MELFGYSVVGFLVAIAILVTVHEFGHYWVAKKLGIKVLQFSIGFGKPLFSWTRPNNPTQYVIAMIPLGGFVRMLDEREGDVAPTERHLAFNTQSLWKRSAVVFAGPAFNFIFAILAMWVVFLVGKADFPPTIGGVAESSFAADLGMQAGDEIISVDGMATQTLSQHHYYILDRALGGDAVAFELANGGATRTLSLDFANYEKKPRMEAMIHRGFGFYPSLGEIPAVVGELLADKPAALAGMAVGDEVIAIDGEPINIWQDMTAKISENKGESMLFTVRRGDTEEELAITPATVEFEGKTYRQVGIAVQRPDAKTAKLQFPVFAALGESIHANWLWTTVTLRSIGYMLSADLSPKNISGPITIAQFAGASVQVGWLTFMTMLALISLSLGIMNLLPVPVLDGGHLLYFLIEAIKGSPVSERTMIVGQKIGLVMLGMLMLLAFYNDIFRLFQGTA